MGRQQAQVPFILWYWAVCVHCGLTMLPKCWKLCVLSQTLGLALLSQCMFALLPFCIICSTLVVVSAVADGHGNVGKMWPSSAVPL